MVEPKEDVVPYSKETVVATPLAVTVAFNAAAVSAIFEAAALLIEGLARLDVAPVVNRDSNAP